MSLIIADVLHGGKGGVLSGDYRWRLKDGSFAYGPQKVFRAGNVIFGLSGIYTAFRAMRDLMLEAKCYDQDVLSKLQAFIPPPPDAVLLLCDVRELMQ